jgi:hypothetical protein
MNPAGFLERRARQSLELDDGGQESHWRVRSGGTLGAIRRDAIGLRSRPQGLEVLR